MQQLQGCNTPALTRYFTDSLASSRQLWCEGGTLGTAYQVEIPRGIHINYGHIPWPTVVMSKMFYAHGHPSRDWQYKRIQKTVLCALLSNLKKSERLSQSSYALHQKTDLFTAWNLLAGYISWLLWWWSLEHVWDGSFQKKLLKWVLWSWGLFNIHGFCRQVGRTSEWTLRLCWCNIQV